MITFRSTFTLWCVTLATLSFKHFQSAAFTPTNAFPKIHQQNDDNARHDSFTFLPQQNILDLQNNFNECGKKSTKLFTMNSSSDYISTITSTKDFWGVTRTKEEITTFVSSVLSSNGSMKNVDVISEEPPLFVIHDFIPEEMCDQIIDAAIEQGGLARSTMGSEQEESDYRTSSNTWLAEQDCELPLRTLAEYVSRISCVPPGHMENLQVVRYFPGQKFDLHTDHLDSFNDIECRGRLATCLIYLNSAVPNDENENGTPSAQTLSSSSVGTFTGGSTTFPEFEASVSPKKGSAVFFWNTKERPGMEGYHDEMFLHADYKMRHSGDAVLSGEKWACNRWIHPIPYDDGIVRGL